MHTIRLVIVAGLLFTTPLLSHASTVIHNDVSVSASEGESRVYIQTTHDGEVVEEVNISSPSPIEYSNTYVAQNETTTTVDNEALIATLTTILNELRALLAYYESLLNQ